MELHTYAVSIMLRNEMCLNIIVIVSTIFAATIIMVTLTRFANFGIGFVQGQTDSTSATSDQKAVICDPNNPKLNFVNTTESKICGIPKTPTAAINNTTGTETAAPSVVPTPSDES